MTRSTPKNRLILKIITDFNLVVSSCVRFTCLLLFTCYYLRVCYEQLDVHRSRYRQTRMQGVRRAPPPPKKNRQPEKELRQKKEK